MPKRVIALSGPVRSGKSTLAANLRQRFGAHVVKTRELILHALPGVSVERKSLQLAGEKLDRQTKGRWVVDAMRRVHSDWFTDAGPDLIVIDGVRIDGQLDALRETFGKQVIHIHLTASTVELRKRFRKSSSEIAETSTYAQVQANPTERRIHELASKADVVIETDRNTQQDVLVRAAARINLLARMTDQLVDVIIGAQYGSEGKGNVVSYLAPEYSCLVRVGSINAGHQVYLDPIYKFRQLPSGTLHNESAKLVLGPGTQIGLDVLRKEIGECKVRFDRLFIDPLAMIIEGKDVDWETARLAGSIGSTAQGVGHAASRRILRLNDVRLAKDVSDLRPYLKPTTEVLEQAYLHGEKVLLEGTQGTYLSLYHGDYPYVTSRDTTASGTMAEAGIAPGMVRKVLMVCRTYPIRVESPKGATSGPMSQEINWGTVSERCGIPEQDLQEAERTTTTGRKRRVGEFDWHQLRRASLLNRPTDIALTFADYHTKENQKARRFDQLSDRTIDFIEEVERVASAPVSLISTRFHWRSIIDRRVW